MCIAIYNQPDKKALSKAQVDICAANNPDGAGIVYAHENRLHIFRTIARIDRLWKHYRRARKLGAPVVLHFRLATHGLVNIANTHPFQIGDSLAFVHNGIISIPSKGKKDKRSDTAIFRDDILRGLPAGWRDNESILTLMEKFCIGSKLLFIDADGRVDIVNEKLGHWRDGTWYSNHSYCEVPRYTTHTGWRDAWASGGGVYGDAIAWETCDECSQWVNDCKCALSPEDKEQKKASAILYGCDGAVLCGHHLPIDADTESLEVLEPDASAGIYCDMCDALRHRIIIE